MVLNFDNFAFVHMRNFAVCQVHALYKLVHPVQRHLFCSMKDKESPRFIQNFSMFHSIFSFHVPFHSAFSFLIQTRDASGDVGFKYSIHAL